MYTRYPIVARALGQASREQRYLVYNEEIRVSIIIIKISNVNMFILCDLKGLCLNHDHIAHVYEYMGTECSKLRQPMRAIFALSRAQLLLLVVTRSRELSRECHMTKHKTQARCNFPLFNFENSGTIEFSSSSSTIKGLCLRNFEKRAHPILWHSGMSILKIGNIGLKAGPCIQS